MANRERHWRYTAIFLNQLLKHNKKGKIFDSCEQRKQQENEDNASKHLKMVAAGKRIAALTYPRYKKSPSRLQKTTEGTNVRRF